jgi:hypothetical protein
MHRSAVVMVNKAEHRYQVKASVSGRSIISTQLWSKSVTARSLPRIEEGLYRAQVTRRNNYFVKSIGQFYYYVVAKKVELSPIAIPGGRPQIFRLRFVKFEVDGIVCCSCEFLRGLVFCADISWNFFTTWMNPWLMFFVEQHLGFILESRCMLESQALPCKLLSLLLKSSKLASQVWIPAILCTVMG